MTATQQPEPRSSAAASHGCTEKNGSSAHSLKVAIQVSGSSSASGSSSTGGITVTAPARASVVPDDVVPERCELALERVVGRRDQEHAHQYLPSTNPPSTRTKAPVV